MAQWQKVLLFLWHVNLTNLLKEEARTILINGDYALNSVFIHDFLDDAIN